MSWPMVKLGKLATINPRLPKDTDEQQEVSFVGMASASEDGKLINEEIRVLSDTKKGFTYFTEDDVLLAKITPCFENGKCLQAGQISKPIGFGSTEFHVVRANPELLDSKYLFYMVWSNTFRFYGQHSMSGAAGQKRVSADFIKNYEIPHPPLQEQKRIAAILDKADAIRRKRQQAVELADEFLRSVFLDMFGDPVVNPKRWKVVGIDKVCSDIVDCVNRTAKTVDYETPYKMIRTTNVRNYKVDLENVRYVAEDVYTKWTRRLTPQRGDIIFTREAPAGEAGIIESDDLAFLGQRTMHFRPDLSVIDSSFLLHELMGVSIKDQIRRLSSGSTVVHLSVPECKKFQVRTPPLELQKRFGEIRRRILSTLTKYDSAATDQEQAFSSLSQKAFSGNL